MAKEDKREVTETEIKYAEYLYTEKGIAVKAIAEELNRNIKTIYAWRDKNNWDETKELFESGPIELKRKIMQEAIRLSNGEKAKIEADAFSKIMKAYDYMKQKLSVEVYRDAFVDFDNWMVAHDPKKALEFTHYHKLFLQEKISSES